MDQAPAILVVEDGASLETLHGFLQTISWPDAEILDASNFAEVQEVARGRHVLAAVINTVSLKGKTRELVTYLQGLNPAVQIVVITGVIGETPDGSICVPQNTAPSQLACWLHSLLLRTSLAGST